MFKVFIPVSKSELDLIFYELRMLNLMFPLGYLIRKNGIDKNARLNSFLVHSRNLIYFLEGMGRKDDILITQFKSMDGKNLEPISIDIDNVVVLINKHLQHLTKARIKEKIGWDVYRIKSEINQGITNFIFLLSDDYFPTAAGRIKEDFNKLILDALIIS